MHGLNLSRDDTVGGISKLTYSRWQDSKVGNTGGRGGNGIRDIGPMSQDYEGQWRMPLNSVLLAHRRVRLREDVDGRESSAERRAYSSVFDRHRLDTHAIRLDDRGLKHTVAQQGRSCSH